MRSDWAPNVGFSNVEHASSGLSSSTVEAGKNAASTNINGVRSSIIDSFCCIADGIVARHHCLFHTPGIVISGIQLSCNEQMLNSSILIGLKSNSILIIGTGVSSSFQGCTMEHPLVSFKESHLTQTLFCPKHTAESPRTLPFQGNREPAN